MITICWAAKGGSGATVVSASLALITSEPTLLVDLAGDLPAALGLPDPDSPGVRDWLASDASADRLVALEIPVSDRVALLPVGERAPGPARWHDLADHLRRDHRHVVVDAGTRPAPQVLTCLGAIADRSWLVTRPCYLSLRAAVQLGCTPTGVVLIDEPGRSLSSGDIEASIGAPVAATLLLDPAVARAVDAGLLIARLPSAYRRQLQRAA